jgi:hypothetical protein
LYFRLEEACKKYRPIAEGFKDMKNVVFKVDMRNTVEERNIDVYRGFEWRTGVFDIYPDSIPIVLLPSNLYLTNTSTGI